MLNPTSHFPWVTCMADLEAHTLKIAVSCGGAPVLLRFIHFGAFDASDYSRIAREIAQDDPALLPGAMLIEQP